jgi:hypothetical protein
MAAIVPAVFAGYGMDFRLTLPRNCETRCFGADGGELAALPYGETELGARSVRFRSPMSDLLAAPPASMRIQW